ncbi:MAG: EAL domain-containing protein [Pseudomonadota bacterium]
MSNKRIVAVDDEASLLHLLAEFGRLQGVEVTCFPAWDEDVKSHVNLSEVLFLDMQLPGSDGLDVITELSDASYDGAIVLISGVDEVMLEYAVKYASSKGLNLVGFLQKPFNMDDFSSILAECESFENKAADNAYLASTPELNYKEVRKAITSQWFYPVFQPQINVETGSIVGIECLARLEHPSFGNISPTRFIPTLERSRIINDFTKVLVDTALNQLTDLLEAHDHLTISFNISSKTLNRDTAVKLIEIINKFDVRPEQIVFEATETSALDISEETEFALTKLRLFGVGLSIDDFGTGYSTISQINKLPFNEIKVDQSFIQHIADKQTSRAIVASTCQLAHNLNYKLVAEGVETLEQLAFLKEHKCKVIQGYLYSKPLSIVQLRQFIQHFNIAVS